MKKPEPITPLKKGDDSKDRPAPTPASADLASLAVRIAREIGIRETQAKTAALLLSEGATVPFIARYRKEATGGLDETEIIAVRDRLEQLESLEKRRDSIINSLSEQGKLSPELLSAIKSADTLVRLEDIYLPYRPKKRTKAMIAREKGLLPLAEFIMRRRDAGKVPMPQDLPPLSKKAEEYVDPEKGIHSAEDALQGARDIIAELVSEDPDARSELRTFFARSARLSSSAARGVTGQETSAKDKQVKDGGSTANKYADYFDYDEPAAKAPSHRILAVLRGSAEGVLAFHILPDEDEALGILRKKFRGINRELDDQIEISVKDSYKRLLAPSLETELKNALKQRADADAISVFAVNLKGLLMAPPMGRKPTIALDPGLRTGCKVACLGAQGELLHYETIYPLAPHNKIAESAERLILLAKKYDIQAVAVGNGTGGREAIEFCEGIDFGRTVIILPVNENGASVYSASETARKEFPDVDLTVRGAVSIGRRLMDPLSELVKIDPKAIGVGQYQHDVDQKMLKNSLDDVVEGCVNKVGVELNTASRELLRFVAGLSEKTAAKIIERRNSAGPFSSREELLAVPGLGEKTFEQAAGFLRIRDGANPLDASAVHPERYGLVERIAADLGCEVGDLLANPELRRKINPQAYVSGDVGLPTLKDILAELEKPGRDPRKEFSVFKFMENVKKPEDLSPGMILPGMVTNVTDFGAFVDIGVHQDGLVHISELSDSFVKNPKDVVKVQQQVSVKVLAVDLERRRISLSMKGMGQERQAALPRSGGTAETGFTLPKPRSTVRILRVFGKNFIIVSN